MKKIFQLLLMTISLSIYSQNNYDHSDLVNNLKLNTVFLLEDNILFENEYYSFYKINKEQHKQRLKKYNETKDKILLESTDILDYFLSFENKDDLNCELIKPIHPFAANSAESAICTKEAGLYLIDYYLRADYNKPIKPIYSKILNYHDVKKFIDLNRNLPIKYFRIEYKKWIIGRLGIGSD